MFEEITGLAEAATPENYLETIKTISNYAPMLEAHQRWEEEDRKWRGMKRNYPRFIDRDSLISQSAMLRARRMEKEEISTAVANVALLSSDKAGIIEQYDRDTLGRARKISDEPELSLGWHRTRQKGIGGSSLGKIIGFNFMSEPHRPVYEDGHAHEQMWQESIAEKVTEVTQEIIDARDREFPWRGVIERGHLWEPALISRYGALTGKRVAVSKSTWQGPDPAQIVNVDGIILDDDGEPEGLLECKTALREWVWEKGVPINYRVQVLWYLEATGLKYADVLVKFDSGKFDILRIERGERADGTFETQTIEGYSSIIEKYRADMEEYRADVSMFWEPGGFLYDDLGRIDRLFDPISGKVKGKVPTDSMFVMRNDMRAPYERMPDESFTVPVAYSVRYGGNEVKDYRCRVSPVHYDLRGLSGMDYGDPFSEVSNHDLILAADKATYDFVKQNSGTDVVDLSALRRYTEKKPGLCDFSTAEQASSWIGRFLKKNSERGITQ